MTGISIAIACKDDGLRKLSYSLLTQWDPRNLNGSFEHAGQIIHAGIDVVVLDEGFEDPAREFCALVELSRSRIPVVALMPRFPTYEDAASSAFERSAIATGAVGLDLPTTAEGMGMAIRAAIDNREGAGPTRGPDYGRKRAWPEAWKNEPWPGAWKDKPPTTPPPAPMDFGKITPEQRARWTDQVRQKGKAEYERLTPAPAPTDLDSTGPDSTGYDSPGPDSTAPDPMDALIEAAKAIVIEGAGKAGHVNARGISVYPVPTDLLVALSQALDDAGYAPW